MVFSHAGQLFAAIRTQGADRRCASGLNFRRALCVAGVVLAARAVAYGQTLTDADSHSLSGEAVAGEIMDIAVEHCRRGESEQAIALFQAMRDQLNPPPAILRLIDDLQATGCHRRPLAVNGGGLRLQLGAGWDSNVSQGISAHSLLIGTGSNLVELELDTSYRPRSSPYTQALVDYSVRLPGPGIDLQASVGHRRNTRASAFDLSTTATGASRDFQFGDGTLRTSVALSEVWLGQQHYQRTRGGGLQWLRSSGPNSWLASLTAVDVNYLTQPSQNAFQVETGLLYERRLNAAASLHVGLALQHDKAVNDRPGGDRQGFQVQLGAVFLASGWRFTPELSYAHWASADVFALGLLEVRRRNGLAQAVMQAERPLSQDTSLVLEWRGRSSRDTVVLYGYHAQSFTATLAHRF